MKSAIHFLCHFIFWTWNTCLLMFIYGGMLPLVGWDLVRAIAQGEIPLPFLLPLVGLLVIPPICTGFGWWRLRKHPVLLMRLFYGMEAPLLALCLLRLFILRELTPASTFVLTLGVMAIATFALELTFGYAAYKKGLAWFQMVSHTGVLVVGLYVGALLLFYTIPVLCMVLYGLVTAPWWIDLRYVFQNPLNVTLTLVLGLVLFGISASLFIAMPYALVNMFTRSWGRILQAFGRQYGWGQGWLVTGGVVAGLSLGFALVYPQPQTAAFAQLASVPAEVGARQAMLRQSPQIRAGLLNAYLFPYRYLSPWNEANALRGWYESVFFMPPEQAQRYQDLHNLLLSPFLYQGDRADAQKAADLYAEFFDVPLQRAEKDAIVHALQSTANRDSVEASVLNINQRVVFLAKQEVAVKERGDWAAIELYERYENPTRNEQEIFYQFTLPESAVLTGIWLGEAGLASRYPFVVSPRGAAQQVYKAEIERSKQQAAEDPALLEQVGPRQYRLRVFPIPPGQGAGRPGVTHLWLTYQVMQQDGAWPLPHLAEKRNVYWTAQTQRRRGGDRVQDMGDTWLEASLPAKTVAPPTAHAVAIADTQVQVTPMAQTAIPLPQNQRFALVLDTSRSMGDRRADVQTALNQAAAIAANNTVDWYISTFPALPPQRLGAGEAPDLGAIAFYGSLSLVQQLQQFDQLRQEAAVAPPYDAIFLLTDRGNYELEPNAPEIPALNAALYLVHLGADLPAAYEDTLLQTLYDTGGGVAVDLQEAVTRYSTEQGNEGTAIDGYRWQMRPGAALATVAQPGEFAPLAARQVIRWLSRSQDASQLAVLNQLHALAKQHRVVTPYSSMLVLVNDRQRQALAAAESSGDRFNRTVEAGNDELTDPGNPLNTASIPEPSSVLGILAVGGVMLWGLRRRPLPEE